MHGRRARSAIQYRNGADHVWLDVAALFDGFVGVFVVRFARPSRPLAALGYVSVGFISFLFCSCACLRETYRRDCRHIRHLYKDQR